MEIISGVILLIVIYQIYSTHKSVNKLVTKIEELEIKIDELRKWKLNNDIDEFWKTSWIFTQILNWIASDFLASLRNRNLN